MADLFTTIEKGKTYTCYDKEAYSWEIFGYVDLSGQRVTVMQIDAENGYACVEMAGDRTKNYDVKLNTLKKC